MKEVYDKFNDHFHITNTSKTTIKIRSWLQSQSDKAGELDIKQRDFLMSNHKIFNSKIDAADGNNKVDKLPSRQHPFDHFFIVGEIDKNSPKITKKSNSSS